MREACQFWVVKTTFNGGKFKNRSCRHKPGGVYEWADGKDYPICDYHLGIMDKIDPRRKYHRSFEVWPGTYEEWQYWMNDKSEPSNLRFIVEMFPDDEVKAKWTAGLVHQRRVALDSAGKLIDTLISRMGTAIEEPLSVQVLIDKGIEFGLYNKRPRGQFLLNIAWKAGLIRKFARHRQFGIPIKKNVVGKDREIAVKHDHVTKGGRNFGVHYLLKDPTPVEEEVIQFIYARRYRDQL